MRDEAVQASRREFLGQVALGSAAALLGSGAVLHRSLAEAAKGAVTLADVGVGDPGGDWSRFRAQ